MIDDLKINVQGLLNKEQLGYLKPLYFNSFLNNALWKVYNRYLSELRSSTRKSNWMLDGKNMADYSEHVQQCLEHYSFHSDPISSNPDGTYAFPPDLEYVEDIFVGTTRIEKLDYADFLDLQTNNYAGPSACNQFCSKVGGSLKVLPTDTGDISIHYLRRPKTPKWTFQDDDGKAMFDPTANDFQDIDAPQSSYDELVSLVLKQQ